MQGSPAVSAGAVVYTFQKNADPMGATIATPWLHLKAVDTVAGDAWFSLPGSRFNPAITALDHNKSYTVTWTVSAEILIVSSGVAELLGYCRAAVAKQHHQPAGGHRVDIGTSRLRRSSGYSSRLRRSTRTPVTRTSLTTRAEARSSGYRRLPTFPCRLRWRDRPR